MYSLQAVLFDRVHYNEQASRQIAQYHNECNRLWFNRPSNNIGADVHSMLSKIWTLTKLTAEQYTNDQEVKNRVLTRKQLDRILH